MSVEATVYRFGAGRVYLGEQEVGDLRDFVLECSREIAEYRGASANVQDAAIKSEAWTFKASSGGCDAAMRAAVLGATVTTGYKAIVTETGDTAPGTVTVANSAAWLETLEVTHPTYGRMTKVVSAPALGEFSVAAGVYTFNASETGIATITYRYTVAGSGKNAIIASALQRQAPRVKILAWNNYNTTQPAGVEIYAAVITKWGEGAKQAEFLDPGTVEGFAVKDSTTTGVVRFDYV